ncbi:hypothetical protein [Georgenia wangjunii]|uniref:hypothetical protein n=1 Tax=Georgenia wangjunii TaxID=3117730 RepID=UPI002F26BA44
MTGLVVVTILALVCAAGVLALLLAPRQPAEGWHGWLRSSLTAWRGDDLRWKDAADDASDVGDLADLYALSEPVAESAYMRAEDLRETFAAVRLRRPAH